MPSGKSFETPQPVTATGVVEVELRGVAIPYRRPIRWESGVEAEAQFMILRLRDAAGREGMAECTVKPAWNGFDIATFALAFERLVLPVLWAAQPEGAALPERLGRLVENSAPKALLESALWDLARAAGNRPHPTNIPVSGVITRGTPDSMGAEAAQMVERHGFGTLKIKGGQNVSTDVAAVRAVQAAIGHSVSLYVDANGAIPEANAEDYVRRLADLGVIAIEDPYNLKPDPRLSHVQRAISVPLIADFSLDGVSSARTFLEQGCGGISLKPSRFGMRKTLAMGDAAATANALAVVGLFGESQAGAVHLLDAHAALADRAKLLPAEATAPLLLTDHYLRQPMDIAGGHIRRPQGANLADMVDAERLRRLTNFAPRHWTRPQ